MHNFIAAIDQGTTSTRCIIFDHDGLIVSSDQKEHKQVMPHSGWVEHDPLEIWENTLTVVNNALNKCGLSSKEIAAIGITNQRETSLLWNKTNGQPYYNAIVWQDIRTDPICKTIERDGGIYRFQQKTGLPVANYFSGPKIKWLIENIPGIEEEIKHGNVLFGNVDTWLIWNLTGGPHKGLHITDPSNASRTLLFNIHTMDWDTEILQILDIPRSILPEIKPSSSIYGVTSIPFAGIPIAGDLGDQQAALFGQVCFQQGEAKNTYGTGCFLLMNAGHKPVMSKYGLLTTIGYQIANEAAVYCLEGSIAISGALVQWLRDNLKIINNSDQIERLAQSVEDNGGIYFVPAFSGLFAPYWRSDARGAILGMTRFINQGHIARAALEATAYQTREVLEAMEKDSGVKLSLLKADGGMVKNDLLMQFQADILNVPVVKPKVSETTALGAAYAAGLAVGYWKNTSELVAQWAKDKEWVPTMNNAMRENLYSRWKIAVEKTLNWA